MFTYLKKLGFLSLFFIFQTISFSAFSMEETYPSSCSKDLPSAVSDQGDWALERYSIEGAPVLDKQLHELVRDALSSGNWFQVRQAIREGKSLDSAPNVQLEIIWGNLIYGLSTDTKNAQYKEIIKLLNPSREWVDYMQSKLTEFCSQGQIHVAGEFLSRYPWKIETETQSAPTQVPRMRTQEQGSTDASLEEHRPKSQSLSSTPLPIKRQTKKSSSCVLQ